MEVPSRSESPLLWPNEYMAPPTAVVGGLVPIVEEQTIPTPVDSDQENRPITPSPSRRVLMPIEPRIGAVRGQRAIRGRRRPSKPYSAPNVPRLLPWGHPDYKPTKAKRVRAGREGFRRYIEFKQRGGRESEYDSNLSYFEQSDSGSGSDEELPISGDDSGRVQSACTADCTGRLGIGFHSNCCGPSSCATRQFAAVRRFWGWSVLNAGA